MLPAGSRVFEVSKSHLAKPLHAADGAPLFDLTRGVLLGSRCESCGSVFFPARAVCPHCFLHGRLVEQVLEKTGLVHASTVVRVRSALGHEPPYAWGYAAVGGVGVFTRFAGAAPEWFQPGTPVALGFETLNFGHEHLTVHVFHPLEQT